MTNQFQETVEFQLQLPMFCSVEAKKTELDASWVKLPGRLDFYLMMEFPRPWHRKIELSDHFPVELVDHFQRIKSMGKKFKFVAVERNNDGSTNHGRLQIIFYSGINEEFFKFKKIELLVLPEHFVESIIALTENNSIYYNQFKLPEFETTDLFVCTHSDRDRCCGKFGADIVDELKHQYSSIGKLRIWSSSHLGGHRIGPTFMEFPKGNFWGYLTRDNLNSILNRTGNHLSVIRQFRGVIGLDRYSQIVDKEIFKQRGWDWLNYERRSEIIEQGPHNTSIRIIYKSDTESGSITATVRDVGVIELVETQCSRATTLTKFEIVILTE